MAKYDKFTSPKNEGRPVQVESAIRDGAGKNIENNYAKQNGYYAGLSAGHADSTESIDTTVGVDEHSLLTFGTNGGDADIQTGQQDLKSLSGVTIIKNQLNKPIAFSSDECQVTISNNKYTVAINNTTSSYKYIRLTESLFTVISNHKYFFIISDNIFENKPISFQIYLQAANNQYPYINSGTINKKVVSINNTENNVWVGMQVPPNFSYTFSCYIYLIDLTQMFGSNNVVNAILGNGTDEDKYQNLLSFTGGWLPTEYDTGTPLPAKPVKLKTVDYNQWDEVAEKGRLDNHGNPTSDPQWEDRFRSKNFIRVEPNTSYFIKTPSGIAIIPFFYDVNKNFISNDTSKGNTTVTTPANAYYMKFYSTSTDTYNHDICIFLYWDGSRIGYEPYSAHEYDLPNIELNGILKVEDGEVVADGDIIYPDGQNGKKRYVKVRLGALDWVWENSNQRFNSTLPYKAGGESDSTYNWIFGNTRISNGYDRKGNQDDKSYFIFMGSDQKSIYICDSAYAGDASALQTSLANVYVIYELAEEEDLESTPFPGNIYMDDFGTFEFLDENGNQQPGLQPHHILYTANIAGFAETLYGKVNGNADKIAEADGDYPAMNVGHAESAKSIDNVSDEQGATQTEPFIMQGTGCANGIDSVDTSPVAELREKHGNSIVVNQLAQPLTDSTVTESGITISYSNGYHIHLEGTATDTVWSIGVFNFNSIAGHKYLLLLDKKGTVTPNDGFQIYFTQGNFDKTYYLGLEIVECQSGGNATIQAVVYVNAVINFDYDLHIIDLTQMFGSNDNIPDDLIQNPENFFRYYQGSLAYNAGALVNANGRYLKTIGRNQWDEELEDGVYSLSTGSKSTGPTNYMRSKNFIKVIPNTTYYRGLNYWSDGHILFYDKDKNFISSENTGSAGTFTTPSNCCFITFFCNYGGTTYNHDITISLYYEGESGYDQYYPYEEPAKYDTGDEVLRSCCSKRDYKEPNGKIHRRVKELVIEAEDLNNVQNSGGAGYRQCVTKILLTDCIEGSAGDIASYGISSIGYQVQRRGGYWANDVTIQVEKGQYVTITNNALSTLDDFKALCPITIHYELEEEVIEQGTSFAKNIDVDDYGTMEWLDSDENPIAIPQGNNLFYPADYVLFLDTLYGRANGSAENIVIASELSAETSARTSTDSALQAAVGGTLRQCLCVKESLDFDNTDFIDLGDLTWTYDTDLNLFRGTLNDKAIGSKLISTKYKTENNTGFSVSNNCITGTDSQTYAKILFIKDTAYTDATTFKNAMKGVLLAYKKAQ